MLEWPDTDGVCGKWQLLMVMASAKSSGAGFAEKSMFLEETLKGNGNEKNPRFFGGFSRCYDGVGQLLMGQKKRHHQYLCLVSYCWGKKKAPSVCGPRCDGLTYGGDSATDGESGFPHQCAGVVRY